MIHNIRLYSLKELVPEEVESVLETVDNVIDVVPREYYTDDKDLQLSYLNVYEQGDYWVYEMFIDHMLTDEEAQEIIADLSDYLTIDFDLDASFDEQSDDDECVDCSAPDDIETEQ